MTLAWALAPPLTHPLSLTPRATRSGDWADRHFLQSKTLRKAKEVRQQLADIMTQARRGGGG
jgi:hypothetical protein